MRFDFVKRNSFKYEISAVILLIIISWVYFFQGGSTNISLLIAAILGIYMAINIGANDVANNMGPAVGSKTIGIVGAIIIAGIFEAAGALIAGGDVVNTIKGGIIDATTINNTSQFIAIMMGTLVGAALWINIATIFKAPVSATHSIIGGLVGAGITAGGVSIVDWGQIGMIALSWVISPLLGGIIAVVLLLSIRNNILQQTERGNAAEVWVPIYVGIMGWTFSTYLLLKGLKQILKGSSYEVLLNTELAIFIGYVVGVITFIGLRLYYTKRKAFFKNGKSFINKLFNIPLVFAVSLLSFAHGANDVANAIGPLAAINDTISNHIINNGNIEIDSWIMTLGAIGIVLGLGIFGARLIKTVGGEITKLNQIRAFCVALSAAITVIIASQLGLPVSSTHIALGAIFGVGLLREHFKRLKGKNKEYINKSIIKSILLAWFITLPVSGVISAVSYLVIMKIGL